MASQSKNRGIPKATKAALASGETETVDFKRTPESITTDDLVAFANGAGGTIYLGVDEVTDRNGTQKGVIRGCDVSDAVMLLILNKAISCVPPVAVELHIENLAAAPIIRLFVPSSLNKPHCTPKGVYCRRDGVRNRPLHPSELLTIYLEQEASAFAERFESTADRIAANLAQLEDTLSDSIESMGSQLGWAEYKLGDTESTLGAILARVVRAEDVTSDIATRLRTLFRQDDRQDPVRQKAQKEFLDSIVEQLLKDKKLLKGISEGGALQVTAQGKPALELTEEELRSVLAEAVIIAQERTSPKPDKA